MTKDEENIIIEGILLKEGKDNLGPGETIDLKGVNWDKITKVPTYMNCDHRRYIGETELKEKDKVIYSTTKLAPDDYVNLNKNWKNEKAWRLCKRKILISICLQRT